MSCGLKEKAETTARGTIGEHGRRGLPELMRLVVLRKADHPVGGVLGRAQAHSEASLDSPLHRAVSWVVTSSRSCRQPQYQELDIKRPTNGCQLAEAYHADDRVNRSACGDGNSPARILACGTGHRQDDSATGTTISALIRPETFDVTGSIGRAEISHARQSIPLASNCVEPPCLAPCGTITRCTEARRNAPCPTDKVSVDGPIH